MPEKPYDYNQNDRARKVNIFASFLFTLGGLTLSYIADKYGVVRYQDSQYFPEAAGIVIAVPAAIVFINEIQK